MNFIQLVQGVNNRIGIQGTGPSSVDITSYEAQIVNAVKDAWLDIQDYRDQWKWMRDSKSFIMTTGKTSYTPSEIFGPSNRLRNWHKDTFYIQESGGIKQPLAFVDYDVYTHRHINDSVSKKPHEYTIRPWDNTLLFQSPDMAYTILCEYQKTPQELSASADVPEMPSHFHIAIMYKALDDYGAAMSFNEIQQKFNLKYVQALGGILREQLPSVKLKVRGIA